MAGEIGRLNKESNPTNGEKPGFTPQHKESDGSFIDTGVDNPLPSKLYAEDENGNLVQVKTNANGEVLTQLTGRNVGASVTDRGQSTTVFAGGTETVDVYAPVDVLSKIIALRLFADRPTGATSGTHRFEVYLGNSDIRLLLGVSNHDSSIAFSENSWYVADSLQSPPDKPSQINLVSNIAYDEDTFLRILYKNNTDVDQTVGRRIKLITEDSGVV